MPIAGQSDGGYELSVTVTAAAGNASTVFDQTISTANPQITRSTDVITPPVTGSDHRHARTTS